MGLSVNGENNRLTIVVEGRERELTEEVPGLDIAVEGDDNRVRIEYPQTFENSRLKITGNGNCFEAAASYRRTDGVFSVLVTAAGSASAAIVFSIAILRCWPKKRRRFRLSSAMTSLSVPARLSDAATVIRWWTPAAAIRLTRRRILRSAAMYGSVPGA